MSRFTSFLHTLAAFAPLILPAIPGIPPKVAAVAAKEIVAAEKIAGSTGPERKVAVLSAAQFAGANAHELEALDKGIDTTIAVIKDIHARHS